MNQEYLDKSQQVKADIANKKNSPSVKYIEKAALFSKSQERYREATKSLIFANYQDEQVQAFIKTFVNKNEILSYITDNHLEHELIDYFGSLKYKDGSLKYTKEEAPTLYSIMKPFREAKKALEEQYEEATHEEATKSCIKSLFANYQDEQVQAFIKTFVNKKYLGFQDQALDGEPIITLFHKIKNIAINSFLAIVAIIPTIILAMVVAFKMIYHKLFGNKETVIRLTDTNNIFYYKYHNQEIHKIKLNKGDLISLSRNDKMKNIAAREELVRYKIQMRLGAAPETKTKLLTIRVMPGGLSKYYTPLTLYMYIKLTFCLYMNINLSKPKAVNFKNIVCAHKLLFNRKLSIQEEKSLIQNRLILPNILYSYEYLQNLKAKALLQPTHVDNLQAEDKELLSQTK